MMPVALISRIVVGLLERPRLMIGLAGVLAALITLSAVYFEGRRDGRRSVATALAEQDARAARAAAVAERTVDECYDAGRVWDVATGRCR